VAAAAELSSERAVARWEWSSLVSADSLSLSSLVSTGGGVAVVGRFVGFTFFFFFFGLSASAVEDLSASAVEDLSASAVEDLSASAVGALSPVLGVSFSVAFFAGALSAGLP
jgi:hypothetical protein